MKFKLLLKIEDYQTMMKTTSILKNEHGGLMVIISVMLLALLTIISVAASKTANTEISIAANEYVYQRCFYNAEGAILEVVDLLEGSASPLESLPSWMSLDEEVINDSTVFTLWQDSEKLNGVVPQASVIDSQNTDYLSVHHGILSGSSLDMSKPAKHTFSIYGRSKSKGLVMLKIGYAKIY
jgi:hypothetical protein